MSGSSSEAGGGGGGEGVWGWGEGGENLYLCLSAVDAAPDGGGWHNIMTEINVYHMLPGIHLMLSDTVS